MRWARTIGLLVASSALYIASFPPFGLGFLSIFFPLPFFALLEANRYSKGFRLGYALGILSIGGLLYWLAANSGSSFGQALAMWASTIVYLAIAWGVFGGLLAFICRTFGRKGLWSAPFIWTAMEFVQSRGSLGFAWHSLATPWSQHPIFIQFISLTGMFALSFWTMLIAVILYQGIATAREEPGKRRAVKLSVALGTALLLLLAPALHGAVVVDANGDEAGSEGLEVALVQPNVESNRKWRERNVAYLELMKMTMALPQDDLDLVVWPETAVPFVLRENGERLDAMRSVMKDRGAVLLTGISDRRETGEKSAAGKEASRSERIKSAGWRKVNTVHLVRPEADDLEVYEKLHLVPFGEYVPPVLGFLEDMMMDVGSGIFVPGNEIRLFDVPSRERPEVPVRVAAVICLESNYPSLINRFVDAGAELLVVVTNDQWYDGTTQTYQHAQIAILRAVEHRMSVLRCANSGISEIVDRYGGIRASTLSGEQDVIVGRVSVGGKRSFFSRTGHWFPFSSLAITLLLLVAATICRLRNRLDSSHKDLQ